MKKQRYIFALLCLIAISAITSTSPIVVKANPFPGDPIAKINSPTNSTYESNTLVLDVTVMNRFDNYSDTTTRTLSYSFDEQPSVPIENVTYHYFEDNSTSIVTGSAILSNLTNGPHKLVVEAKYECRIYTYDNTPRPNDSYHIQTHKSKPTVWFTIDTIEPSPTSEPTQANSSVSTSKEASPNLMDLTTIVLVVFFILAVVALVIYRIRYSKSKIIYK